MILDGRLGRIDWVFFDIGSTLVDEGRAYRHRIEDAIAGTEIGYEEFYETMMGYYRKNRKGDLETIRRFGLAQTAWHSEDEVLYPEAKGCLERLKGKYKLGIIANQPVGTAERLRDFGILEDIDLVVSSAEEGVAKPDLRIFQLALERAGCEGKNAVMVGDRLDNDIAPAKRAEMKTVWVRQGFGRFSTPGNEMEKADFTVNDLDGVWRLFEGVFQ
ncbi:HAD family hydrolase [Lachnospiraceae bacterium TF09-5]|nr:HAD family hydrolase [Lachnospiraceae bacterium TF09-5]